MDIQEMMKEMEKIFKPYETSEMSFREIPEKGVEKTTILTEMEKIISKESEKWKEGKVSGAVYHGGIEHIEFSNSVMALASQNNPLHPDVWPSSLKFEREIVSMVTRMLHGDDFVRGSITSGGTESILLAVKTYRDMAKVERGIKEPEIIYPKSAHAAFEKACQYFGIRGVVTGLRDDFSADPEDIKEKITKNTIGIVASAPCFPYGVIDPISDISRIAEDKGIPFHVDACLGGFLLPWAKEIGADVPDFDFSLPGVTSISIDTHKYGFAPKGTSVVLYRNSEIIKHQYFATSGWTGGIYFSPTMAGSRPGALPAAAWASMLEMGKSGYREGARRILETTSKIRKYVESMDELTLLGKSHFVVAFTSKKLNIYQIMEKMSEKGWSLNGLNHPPGVHFAVTLAHTRDGVPEKFDSDLRKSIEEVEKNPGEETGTAPVYGMAATFPEDAINELIKSVVEWMYS
ncbi:MAG: aspartate aminotransferase family protein [Candidatus Thermoplasmatota archaeon]|jgi:glutamate/tyrosine decarboxylase-like PLP-dependent enzyme|nr:aspartate aminotransferase family protein [Candidatus Thermoplasmatota archaeon]